MLAKFSGESNGHRDAGTISATYTFGNIFDPIGLSYANCLSICYGFRQLKSRGIAMIGRACRLYGIGVAAFLHKLYYDFARELVVGISATVILGTFLYVFNDFLNVQVSSVSANMRAVFAEAAAYGLLLLSSAFLVRTLRRDFWSQDSLQYVAARFGEDPRVIRVYLLLRCSTTIVVVVGLTWWLNYRYLINWDWQHSLLSQINRATARRGNH